MGSLLRIAGMQIIRFGYTYASLRNKTTKQIDDDYYTGGVDTINSVCEASDSITIAVNNFNLCVVGSLIEIFQSINETLHCEFIEV